MDILTGQVRCLCVLLALIIELTASLSYQGERFMLITVWKPDSIYRYALESLTYDKVPVPNITFPRSIDYDPVEDRMYWTSIVWTGSIITDSEIFSSYLNGSDTKSVRGSRQGSYISGMALDPRSRLLFYTDDTKDQIAYMSLSTLQVHVIVNTSLDEPRSIALNALNGTVYWTDWGSDSKIERANYDGSNRNVLIRTVSPCGLVLDVKNNYIYWTEYSQGQIRRASMDGTEQTVIFANTSSSYFGLALSDDQIYVTDWTPARYRTTVSHLHRISTNGFNVTTLLSISGRMNEICIFNYQTGATHIPTDVSFTAGIPLWTSEKFQTKGGEKTSRSDKIKSWFTGIMGVVYVVLVLQ